MSRAAVTPPVSAYRASGIEKRYGGVVALRDVDFLAQTGEVHALVGANGAGKSTLMKILAGVEQPGAGVLEFGGTELRFANTAEAELSGVAMVSQELSLFPTLDLLENLFITREPTRRGLLSRSRMRAQAREALDAVGLRADVSRIASELRLAERQLLEIARALVRRPQILILDEPTSALNAQETARLLDVVRGLRESNVGVVYVSHFLQDVMAVADVITVLRDGAVVLAREPCSRTNVTGIIEAMLGPAGLQERAAGPEAASAPANGRGGALKLSNVGLERRLAHCGFTAHPGEVVGLAGLEGSGVEAVFEILSGRTRATEGEIELPDGGSAPRNTPAAVRRGVALLPADRQGLGLIVTKPVWENIAMVRLTRQRGAMKLIRPAELMVRAEKRAEQLGLQMASTAMPVKQLSGGNQQRVVFAKWLEADPMLMLLEDPTRGVDVRARADVHRIIRESVHEGRIALFSSSDLEEYEMVCDRVVVLYRGAVVAELAAGAFDEAALLRLVNGEAAVDERVSGLPT